MAYVISTRGVGGAERFLGALVKEGAARGWDQLVLNPFVNENATEMAELYRPARYVPLPCDSARRLLSLRRRLRTELDGFQPDVVHVMLWHALVMTATLRRPTGRRLVVTNMYGEALLRAAAAPGLSAPARWAGRARGVLDRWAGARCDLVFAISEAVGRFLVDTYRYPVSKVRCIPLGWEGEPLPPSHEPRPPTIVCVALLRPEKGHRILLDAFVRVRRQVPDARLVLVGQGQLQAELEARIGELGLEGCVELTGPVPEIWGYLARADVFALASTSEAFGIAIVEAMAAGLPVVASDVGGIPELVQEGVTGALFPPGDAEALAAHLVRILTTHDLRSKMSAAARAAAQRRRLSATTPRYFEACEELLRGGA